MFFFLTRFQRLTIAGRLGSTEVTIFWRASRMKRAVQFGLALGLLATPFAAPLLSAQQETVQPVAKLSSTEAAPDTASQPATPQLQQRNARYHLAAGDS